MGRGCQPDHRQRHEPEYRQVEHRIYGQVLIEGLQISKKTVGGFPEGVKPSCRGA